MTKDLYIHLMRKSDAPGTWTRRYRDAVNDCCEAFVCSECGYEVVSSEAPDAFNALTAAYIRRSSYPRTHMYCPNCGTRMGCDEKRMTKYDEVMLRVLDVAARNGH